MSTNDSSARYDKDFKPTLVNLYQAGGRTQAALCREYGIALMTLNCWLKQYSTVETENGKVFTAKQVKEVQKRMAQLEEENLIQKSHCHLHATVEQGLEAVHKPGFQHDIKLLCKILGVNTSPFLQPTYKACSYLAPTDEKKERQPPWLLFLFFIFLQIFIFPAASFFLPYLINQGVHQKDSKGYGSRHL